MVTDIPASYDDPQFVKVLDTCLRMEIANAQEKFEANMAEMKRLKETIRTEVKKRKQLKIRVAQTDRVRTILSECLTRLRASIIETSDALEAMKANVDDEYKLMQLKTQEYQNLLIEYKKTWHAYRAMYEEFPLAKERRAAKIDLEKRKVEYMVMIYKKKELTTIIKQRREIDWIRMRCKIIEFGSAIVEHSRLEKKLTNLEVDVNYYRRELRSIEAELQMLRKQEEDRERMRRQKILEIAPPKINLPYRNMYNHNRTHARVQSKQFHETYDVDSISINTLILEQLCVNENDTALPNVKPMQVDNAECTVMETESANLPNNTAVSEKIDIPVASMDVEANAEKAALMDNDVEMKESHREEKSQESVKAQPCCRTKENSLKHSAPKNTQDEIEAKRIRLRKEDSAESSNKMSAPPLDVIEEIDLTSPVTVPRIRKIETVHYNVTTIKSKDVQHANAFLPVHNEYCESNMSSIDQDFMLKDDPSLFEESLCNYRLSPNSNISPMCITEDRQMSPSRYQDTLQEDNNNNKNPFGDNTSTFQFDNFMKKAEKAKNDFTLF